jgi:hypothetical protein
MSRWMDQMSEEVYSFNEYQENVVESKIVRWPIRRCMFAEKRPLPGDLLICFYSPTLSKLPGICGFGIILKKVYRQFDWLPMFPTCILQKNPWWDDQVREIVRSVRRKSPRGTMYQLTPEIDTDLRHGLFKWTDKF